MWIQSGRKKENSSGIEIKKYNSVPQTWLHILIHNKASCRGEKAEYLILIEIKQINN